MSLARESTLSKRLRPEHPARQDCSSITSRVQQHCSMDDHWAIKTRASAEPHSCHELRRVHATEGTPRCRSKCDSPSALQAGAAAGAVGGAVGGAAPVLLVVPLPVPLSRYSEPSGDGPAGRRLPTSLRPAAASGLGLARPRARDTPEPSGARENLKDFRGPGGSRREFRQTGRRAQIPSQHGISKPDPRAKRRGVLKNTSAVQGGRVLPSGDIKLVFHDARIAPESGAEALQWCLQGDY